MATAVDLLAFGPHPDDLEIGLGGTLAKHAALGHTVGLCDLTRGEMASNGTPEERVKEAEDAARVLGAAWRENLCLPDRAIGSTPDHARRVVGGHSRGASANHRRFRTGRIGIPIIWRRSRCCATASSTPSSARYEAAGDPWQADVGLLLLHQRLGACRRSWSMCPSTTTSSGGRWRATAASSRAQPERAETRLNSPGFNQLIESRDAQFGALAGVRFAEGHRGDGTCIASTF